MNKNILLFGRGKTVDDTPPPSTGSGSFYTNEDLTLWNTRLDNQTYWTFGKHITNCPCSASDIITFKDFFMGGNYIMKTPRSNSWVYNDYYGGSGITRAGKWSWGGAPRTFPFPSWMDDLEKSMSLEYFGNSQSRNDVINYIYHAAFYAKVKNNVNVATKVIDTLITTLSDPEFDFSNRSYWLPNSDKNTQGNMVGNTMAANETQSWQANPFFFFGDRLFCYVLTYDYIKSFCSQSEQTQIETWLYNWGEFHMLNIKPVIDSFFVDAPNNTQATTTGASLVPSWAGQYTHNGGYGIPRLSVVYNNRLISQVLGIAAAGFLLDNALLKEFAKKTYKEIIKYTIYPDGTTTEFHRSGNTGFHYASSLSHQLAKIAYMYWKAYGSGELFEYTTSDGVGGINGSTSTAGGSKSLSKFVEALHKYLKTPAGGGWDRYSGGTLIDGNRNGRYVQYTKNASIYLYKYFQTSTYLNQITMKTSNGYRRGWLSQGQLENVGYFKNWKAVQGTELDILFQHGPDPSVLI